MNSILHAVVLLLLIAAGGLLTFMAQRFEDENPLATVRLLTPEQWSRTSVPLEVRTLRSPALVMDYPAHPSSQSKLHSSYRLEIPLDSAFWSSDSLVRAFRNIPVLPVDTLRWRLWNQCCGFDLRYPVSLQCSALLHSIAQKGAAEWVVVVPEVHLSTWRRILKRNPLIELHPKM